MRDVLEGRVRKAGQRVRITGQRKDALAAGLFDPESGGPLDIAADDIELLLAGS